MRSVIWMVWTTTLLMVASAAADTTWVAPGTLSGIWTAAHSPYIISGDVEVPAGGSLQLDPGVQVYFAGWYRFYVRGSLRARGAVGDSIIFATDTLANLAKWNGLRFLNATAACSLAFCVIENGRAAGEGDNRYGGGIEVQQSTVVIERSTIRRCRAAVDGGGIYVRDGSTVALTECDIEECEAAVGGGGVMSRSSTINVRDCRVRYNAAGFEGGGLYFRNQSSATLEDCLCEGNRAGSGGGIYSSIGGLTVLRRSIVRGNIATVSGGGWGFAETANISAENSVFSGNTATCGGAIYADYVIWSWPPPNVLHCTLDGNRADSGAAVYLRGYRMDVVNSLVTNHVGGGAISSPGFPLLVMLGSAFYSNADSNWEGVDVQAGAGTLDSVNSNGDACDRYGNLYLDPQYADASSGDYHLSDGSPCIAAGVGPYFPEDMERQARPAPPFTQPDMGAYESPVGSEFLYACGEVSGTIGPGIVHVPCDLTILTHQSLVVEPGTHFLLTGGVDIEVRGALHAEGTESDSITFRPIISTNYWGGISFLGTTPASQLRLAYCVLDSALDPLHVATSRVATIDHCTVSHSGFSGIRLQNAASTTISHCDVFGSLSGGVVITGSTPILSGCRIWSCQSFDGGGVFISQGQPTVEDCEIFGNQALNGGGICVRAPNATIRRCYLHDNAASVFGGGLFIGAEISAESCRISDNSAPIGGGVYAAREANVLDCELTGNHATDGGGAYLFSPGIEVHRCLIAENSATHFGGGVHSTYSARLDSCSLRSNQASAGGGAYLYGVISHCVLDSNMAEAGAAIQVTSDDFRLQASTVIHNDGPGTSAVVFAAPCTAQHVRSSIVAFNTGSALGFPPATVAANFWYNNFHENSEGTSVGPAPDGLSELVRQNIRGIPCDPYRNILEDPELIGEYGLGRFSPCIDSGDLNWPLDPDSTVADIGAHHARDRFPYPSRFNLIAPAALDTVRGLTEFRWEPSTVADTGYTISYDLLIATLDTVAEVWDTLLSIPGGPEPRLTLNVDQLPRLARTSYFWFAVARLSAADAWTRSVNTWQIMLPDLAGPARFHLIAPQDGDTLQLSGQRFSWQHSPDPDETDTVRYRLTVFAHDSVTHEPSVLRSLDTGVDTTVVVSFDSLEQGPWDRVQWYASARSVLPPVEVPSIETFALIWPSAPAFHIPAPFHLLQPAAGDTLRGVREFRWQASVDADTGERVTFSLRFLSYDSVAQEWDTLGTLDAGELTHYATNVNTLGQREHTAYYWHVLAHSLYPPVSVRSIEEHSFVLDTTQAVGVAWGGLPTVFALHPVYPNPFNATASIVYDVPRVTDLVIQVFDIGGRLTATLQDGRHSAGRHRLAFAGRALPSGI